AAWTGVGASIPGERGFVGLAPELGDALGDPFGREARGFAEELHRALAREGVGEGDGTHRQRVVLQGLLDRAAEAAGEDVLLDGDRERDFPEGLQEPGAVDRLDEAGVD